MTSNLSCCFSTLHVETSLAGVQKPQGSALQTIVDILKQPRVRTCPHCQGKGLLVHHSVCPACKGFGKTP